MQFNLQYAVSVLSREAFFQCSQSTSRCEYDPSASREIKQYSQISAGKRELNAKLAATMSRKGKIRQQLEGRIKSVVAELQESGEAVTVFGVIEGLTARHSEYTRQPQV